MADPICRWRNPSPKTVCELVSQLPKNQLSSEEFRRRMKESIYGEVFFNTAYQLACQLGLYLEKDGVYIPRFIRNITEDEAKIYLINWFKNYYVPNPYTKRGFQNIEPVIILDAFINFLEEHGNTASFKDICNNVFRETINNTDILVNCFKNYSQVITIDDDNQVILNPNYKQILIEMTNNRIDKNAFFQQFNPKDSKSSSEEPLQIIYFGAPGTGKSYEIKNEVEGKPHFRTTFHPDTDYASFVGSYKPITKQVIRYDIYSKPIKDEAGKVEKEDRIVYRYVFQSFLKAYIKAWEEMSKENPERVYLIIEEINRGNCAQIFGDIFQLLDRNNEGFSDYPIVSDEDLKQELNKVLGELEIQNSDYINSLYPGQGDVVEKVKAGEILLLPNNLYIRATMNTSDQSLFPIDSAFKRRWDWRYVNIKNHEEANYVISFSNGNKYNWWDFLNEINKRIEGGEIQQEDKKLGYFFAKARNGEISAETFLSKVLFFLYNDVFKDFGLEQDFFKDENGEIMTFASYFDHRGKIIENRVETFLKKLGLEPIQDEETQNDYDGETPVKSGIRARVNGTKVWTITYALYNTLRAVAKDYTYDELYRIITDHIKRDTEIIKTIPSADGYEKEARWYNYKPLTTADGITFVITNQWKKEFIPQIKELAQSLNVTFEDIEE